MKTDKAENKFKNALIEKAEATIQNLLLRIKDLEGELHLKNNRFLEVSKHTPITQLVNENKTAVERYQNSIVEAMMNKSK